MRDGDIATQREVLAAALVERVVPVRVRRGTSGVEIDWTPAFGEALGAALDAPLSTAMSQAA